MLVPVRFLHQFHVYNEGDVAGFPKERADAMVAAKIATLFKAEGEPKQAAKPKRAAKPKPTDADQF